uniref:Cytochrome c oxidase subunit 5A, mitochondrial n=1 Tax=Culex pipiens TaxID=7175 RepID=A0A8D8HZN7_CULPI
MFSFPKIVPAASGRMSGLKFQIIKHGNRHLQQNQAGAAVRRQFSHSRQVRCSVEILELDEFEILHRLVLIPDPKIMVTALKDCRRLNDDALAIRFLEAAKDRCGDQVSTIYPYLLQELRPKLCELGIEELGYDKPELAITLDMEK